MKKIAALIASAVVSACDGAGDAPAPPDPGEPNGSVETATPLTPGTPVVATISATTDADYFRFSVPAGGASVRVQTFDEGGATCGLASAPLDTYVEVFDPAATPLLDCDAVPSPCDDSGVGWCEDVTVVLPAGTSYVAVSGYPPYPLVYTLVVTIQ